MKSQYKLHLGNTKKIITDMINRNEKVDMIFTSPPYYSMRKNYSGNDDGEIGSIHVDDYADWFLEFTDLGLFSLILAPGIAQAVYQNWKWPMEVIKDLKITKDDFFNIKTFY